MPFVLNAGQQWELRVSVTGPVGGFTQRYPLQANTPSQAELDAIMIVDALAHMLASGFAIYRAVIVNLQGLRQSIIINGYDSLPVLLDAETVLATEALANTQEVGLLVRFDNTDGVYVNRIFRGIRDSWVSDNLLTVTPSAAYAIGGPYINGAVIGEVIYGEDLAVPALDTSANIISNAMSIIRDKCYMLRQVGTTPKTWECHSFDNWSFSNISKRDTGARPGATRGRQASMS